VTAHDDGLVLRPGVPEDDAGIRDLVAGVMGWGENDRAERMWTWKHEESPFGRSARWVAEDAGRIVAVRIFLRWEFAAAGGQVQRAVRAVDTVTDPAYRGRGLFRRLTLQAIDDLAREGVGFVFNTPNHMSRPGYLSMGWESHGRVPVAVWAKGLTGWTAMVRSRVPADLGSLPSDAGFPATDALDDDAVTVLARPGRSIGTRRSAAYLRWRYAGLPDLRYRVVRLGRDPHEGVSVVRVRRRGAAVETAIVESYGPSRRQRMRLTREVVRATRAGHALTVPQASGALGVRVPRTGPQLTMRRITVDPTPTGALDLALGDVELF
jgi:GNAT superfamily N-acetyltransferase